MSELIVERTGKHEFAGRNERGATVRIGRNGAPGSFSPGELLKIAAASCASLTVEEMVTRRAGEDARIVTTVEHERAEGVVEYEKLLVTMRTDLSFLDADMRERVIRAMQTAVRKQCTVSRTLERGSPVELTIE